MSASVSVSARVNLSDQLCVVQPAARFHDAHDGRFHGRAARVQGGLGVGGHFPGVCGRE